MPEKTTAHAPELSRYELELDGQIVGVGAELVDFALRDTEEDNLKVLPYCWYVRDRITQHPEYLELVPAESRASFGLGG